MFRVFVIFLLAVCFSLLSFSRNLSDNDRVRDLVNRYGQAEIYVPYSDYRTLDYLSEKVSVLNVTDKIIEISLSKLTVEWFLSQKYSYSIKEKPDLKGILSSGAQSKAFVWDSYPTYTQYDSLMQSFELNYPTLCRLDTIGTSVNGRMVFALKISDNPGADEAEPSVFYTSTMHGDETGGFMMMLRLADFLLKNYSEDAQVKELTDNLQIWINPLANPDGTYNSGNSISSPVRYNALGKDLNRDFPDPTLIDTNYAKENIDMIRFMRKHRFVISANFHSGNEVVNYPWDRWLTKFHADDTWFYEISRAYADTVHIYSDPDYMRSLNNGVTRGSVWYVIKGGRQDFMTQELHGREVTIEVDDEYVTPADQLSTLWENNRHSLLGYLENALYGIHGVVLDSESYAPVPAEVFIKGHDKDSSQVYSDILTGHFVRMIYPGIWPLTFSASGYRDTTINVAANDRQKTDITVYMVKGTIPPDSLLPEPPALYPNPASSVINAVLTDDVTGSVNVIIINSSGKVMLEYDTEAYSDIPLIIDISRLASGIYSAVFTNSRKKSSCRGRFIVIK